MKKAFRNAVVILQIGAGALGSAAVLPTGAAAAHQYEIVPNDGYGIADCLVEGGECGQVVADAWCDAHGFGHALAFGPREAVDNRPSQVSTTAEPYVIRCDD